MHRYVLKYKEMQKTVNAMFNILVTWIRRASRGEDAIVRR